MIWTTCEYVLTEKLTGGSGGRCVLHGVCHKLKGGWILTNLATWLQSKLLPTQLSP